jgi:hypothetical protein
MTKMTTLTGSWHDLGMMGILSNKPWHPHETQQKINGMGNKALHLSGQCFKRRILQLIREEIQNNS